MDEQPKLEDTMNRETLQAELDEINENTSRDEVIAVLRLMVKEFEISHEKTRRNELVLIEALEQAQTKYKNLEERSKAPWKRRIKKVLIAWGWYEASQKELEEIHYE